MDETGEFEGSIRKTQSFADGTLHLDDPVHEKGHFRGQGVDLTGFIHEKWRFHGREYSTKKRHPRKDVSVKY